MSSIPTTDETSRTEDNTPDKFDCTVCEIVIKDGVESSIQCECCQSWSHTKCSMNMEVFRVLEKISKDAKKVVKAGRVLYFCSSCLGDIISFIDSKKNDQASDAMPAQSTAVCQVCSVSSAAESREVAGRQLVDGERSHSSPPTSQTPLATHLWIRQ